MDFWQPQKQEHEWVIIWFDGTGPIPTHVDLENVECGMWNVE